MTHKSDFAEYLISRLIHEYLFKLEASRTAHLFCKGKIHYVVITDVGPTVLHDEQLDEANGDVLMSSIDIHNSFFSESQRETLIDRLTNYLRSQK